MFTARRDPVFSIEELAPQLKLYGKLPISLAEVAKCLAEMNVLQSAAELEVEARNKEKENIKEASTEKEHTWGVSSLMRSLLVSPAKVMVCNAPTFKVLFVFD